MGICASVGVGGVTKRSVSVKFLLGVCMCVHVWNVWLEHFCINQVSVSIKRTTEISFLTVYVHFVYLRYMRTFKVNFESKVWHREGVLQAFGSHSGLGNASVAWLIDKEPAWESVEFFTAIETCDAFDAMKNIYSLVQWNWFSGMTGCTWISRIQWCQRTNFTAPGCIHSLNK